MAAHQPPYDVLGNAIVVKRTRLNDLIINGPLTVVLQHLQDVPVAQQKRSAACAIEDDGADGARGSRAVGDAQAGRDRVLPRLSLFLLQRHISDEPPAGAKPPLDHVAWHDLAPDHKLRWNQARTEALQIFRCG